MCKNCENGGKPMAAVWWRVSGKAQMELSPETQVKEAKQMLEAEGYEVPDDRIIGSDWHSLTILDCPQMETLLDWVRRAEVHAIGMYHGDRLAGNPGQKMFIVDLADRHNVKLLARYSPIMEGKEGELLEYVRTWGKEQQVIRTQQAAKDGLRDRALVKGLPPSGRPPYGYGFPQTDEGRDYTRLVPNNDWTVASYIWKRALEGTSMRRIIRELYDKGIQTATGKAIWSAPVIHSILRNPAYSGRYHALRRRAVTPKERRADTYGKSSRTWKDLEEWAYLPNVTVENPVVTWEEYLGVQDRLKANKRYSLRNAKRQYLLRGMIFCETHNKPFNGHRRKPEVGFYYTCPVTQSLLIEVEGCVRKSIGGPTLEKRIWGQAVELLRHPEALLGEMDRRREAQQETETSIQEAIGRADKRLRANENAEMELVALRIRSSLSDGIYERQKSLLKAEKTWLDEEIERLNRQLENTRQRFVSLEEVKALRERLGAKLDRVDFEAKRFVLESLETKIAVAPDGGVQVTFAIPMPQASIVSAIPYRDIHKTTIIWKLEGGAIVAGNEALVLQ